MKESYWGHEVNTCNYEDSHGTPKYKKCNILNLKNGTEPTINYWTGRVDVKTLFLTENDTDIENMKSNIRYMEDRNKKCQYLYGKDLVFKFGIETSILKMTEKFILN